MSDARKSGAWSEPKPATQETQDIADKVKKAAEEQVGMVFKVYKAIEYQTQVVAGTNFRIIIKVTDFPQNAELVVFRNLEDQYSLTSAKLLIMEKP
ncbi:cystatin-B-like [Dysidea avara]|uniref:cystatin-B-like n=1 Tax=Dysidea avara TaxID=196820 RepID=UPI00332CDB78